MIVDDPFGDPSMYDDERNSLRKRLAFLEVKLREERSSLLETESETRSVRDQLALLDRLENGVPSTAADVQIHPPAGECNTALDWAAKTVDANPGRLNRGQLIAYLRTKIKCNSKDRDQSVGDALSKNVRSHRLRVSDDGCYWPDSSIRQTPSKEVQPSIFSGGHALNR
jgi:hypothetical protein